MKRLAKKLMKFQENGTLKNETPKQFTSVNDFVAFIRLEMRIHADRMNLSNIYKPIFRKRMRHIARKSLHRWLNELEIGIVNYR